MIVQTHGHVDHCVGSSSLARRFGIPIAMHELDVPLYKSIHSRSKRSWVVLSALKCLT